MKQFLPFTESLQLQPMPDLCRGRLHINVVTVRDVMFWACHLLPHLLSLSLGNGGLQFLLEQLQCGVGLFPLPFESRQISVAFFQAVGIDVLDVVFVPFVVEFLFRGWDQMGFGYNGTSFFQTFVIFLSTLKQVRLVMV